MSEQAHSFLAIGLTEVANILKNGAAKYEESSHGRYLWFIHDKMAELIKFFKL